MVDGIEGKLDPKILVLVVHGPYEPWLSILRDGQMKTWMQEPGSLCVVNVFGKPLRSYVFKLDQQVYYLRWRKSKLVAYISLSLEILMKTLLQVFRYKPKVKSSKHEGKIMMWQVQMLDSLLLQGVKNLAALRESLSLDYDFLVTTITSSYINTEALKKFLKYSDKEKFLGGRIEMSGGKPYQQGSFRVFSRDVVEQLVSVSNKYKHWKIEDIALGDLARRHYKKFVDIPNLTIEKVEEVKGIDISSLSEVCSYRCKAFGDNGERVDAKIMKKLHKLIIHGKTNKLE